MRQAEAFVVVAEVGVRLDDDVVVVRRRKMDEEWRERGQAQERRDDECR